MYFYILPEYSCQFVALVSHVPCPLIDQAPWNNTNSLPTYTMHIRARDTKIYIYLNPMNSNHKNGSAGHKNESKQSICYIDHAHNAWTMPSKRTKSRCRSPVKWKKERANIRKAEDEKITEETVTEMFANNTIWMYMQLLKTFSRTYIWK